MAETLTKDVALALLGNTLPTGAILVVLITILGPISGAHFNPAVSLVFALEGRTVAARCAALCRRANRRRHRRNHGRACDVRAAADRRLAKMRTGGAQWFAEGVAAFGLVATILGRHPVQPPGGAVAGRPLHHRGLLVHGLDVVCQSGRCDRAIADQHVFRHPPRRSSRLHRRRTLRRGRGADVHELAAARGRRGGNDQRRPGHERHDLSQPRLRHLAQHAGDDPPERRGARGHRIPEDAAEPRPAGRTDRGAGHFAARAAAREGHALCRARASPIPNGATTS